MTLKSIAMPIKTSADIEQLVHISNKARNDAELISLLYIFKEYGAKAVQDAISRCLVPKGEMKNLVGKEVFMHQQWVEVLTSKPIANKDGWACTFSDRPDLVYILDNYGYTSTGTIYMVRDKAVKPKGGKSKAVKELADKAGITGTDVSLPKPTLTDFE